MAYKGPNLHPSAQRFSTKDVKSHQFDGIMAEKTVPKYEGEMAEREAKAKEKRWTVMSGHKQGLELVTDPEMIKLMGRKQL